MWVLETKLFIRVRKLKEVMGICLPRRKFEAGGQKILFLMINKLSHTMEISKLIQVLCNKTYMSQ